MPFIELHDSLGWDGFALNHIQMKAVMQREHFATHTNGDHSGLAFDLDDFILPDDEVADFKVKGFFSPGDHAQLLQVFLAVAINTRQE